MTLLKAQRRVRLHSRRFCGPVVLALCLAAILLCSAPVHAGGEHDHHHGMPMGTPLGVEGPPVEGRQLCTYRPLMGRTIQCGTEEEIRPGPPLRGQQLMFEANSFTGLAPTPAQRKAADDMVAACEASAAKNGWSEFEKGIADGYELLFGDTVHYVNDEYLFDDAMLDCDRPEYLMYYDTPSGKQLVGFMFITQKPLDYGPQFGGALTRWHYHYWAKPHCMRDGMRVIGRPKKGECEEGVVSFRSPEMLHVWLLDHPAGRFSPMMHLDDAMVEELLGKQTPSRTDTAD